MVRCRSPVRLLTFSTLFPHAARPNHGIFVENRLRHLLASGEATSTVLAPVPWFPSRSSAVRRLGAECAGAGGETRHGIAILHPRYPVIPKIGMSAAPWLLYRAMLPHVARLLAEGHAVRRDRRALRLSRRRRRRLAGPPLRVAGGDHRARHRRQPDPALPGPAPADRGRDPRRQLRWSRSARR